ncbi:Hsp20 family protein [Aestuariispira ectoiniformans]|uniref:Hsp20 family protein n=1 Tax=Aestuariispira ectoiniformans TaxID=2775080 RepID=UPI00223C1E33|nr:Hsp20 family protein [Aestuariispira ectoiniformans]
MSRITMFDSPLFLGFEHFERTLDRIAKTSAEGYPPYNIEQIGEDRLRITLAVAGFSEEELTVQRDGNQLVVAGRRLDRKDDERIFLHRGIASRQFQRSFLLAEGIDIESASLENGLLNVDLRQPLPQSRVQTIKIDSGKNKAIQGRTLDVDPNEGAE